MADDINIIDSTGNTQAVGTDLVTDPAMGSAHVQIIKIMDASNNAINRLIIRTDGTIPITMDDIGFQQQMLNELHEIRRLLGVMAGEFVPDDLSSIASI